MTKFTYSDIVRVSNEAPEGMRPGQRAWVFAVISSSEREGEYYLQFPPGPVYGIEFEGGDAVYIQESLLEMDTPAKSL